MASVATWILTTLMGPLMKTSENYMQNPRTGHAIPGALDLGQSTATNVNNAFLLFSYVTPMGFALLSDLSYGRLKTLKIALAYVRPEALAINRES